MNAVVIPHLEIIDQPIAWIKNHLVEIEGVVELLHRLARDGDGEGDNILDGSVFYIGFHHFKFKLGKTVIVLNTARKEETVVHYRILHFHHSNHGVSIINSGDGIGEGIGDRGELVGNCETIAERLHGTIGERYTAIGIRDKYLSYVINKEIEGIHIFSMEIPFNSCSLWNNHITFVGQRLVELMGIGRVGEGRLKIDHCRLGKDLQGIVRGGDFGSLKMKGTTSLNCLKLIRKVALVELLHLISVALDIDKSLRRNCITLYGDTQVKILLLSNL